MANPIQMTGENSFTTEARGVSYYLRLDTLGRWELTTQRLALRAARMGGGVRYFTSLTEVSEKIRAFRGIDQLV